MKAKVMIFAVLICCNIQAQEGLIFISGAIDPKMLFSGPGYSYTEIDHGLNYEISAGFEDQLNKYSGIRAGMAFEVFNEIGYKKWSWVQVDYILYNYLLWFEVEGFRQYAGAEVSVIYREDIPGSYVQVQKSFSAGANFELQYFFDPVGVGLNLNVFRSEAALIRDNKPIRYDVMLKAVVKF